MATVREGSKGVLLVVDVQVDVVKAAWENERVVGNVARAVERARDQKVPVIWVRQAVFRFVPASRMAVVTARSPAATSQLVYPCDCEWCVGAWL